MAAPPPPAARPVVNFITGNANKLREVVAVLEPAIEVRSQALDLVEIQGSVEDVTTDKCKRAAERVSFPVPASPLAGQACPLRSDLPTRSAAQCWWRIRACASTRWAGYRGRTCASTLLLRRGEMPLSGADAPTASGSSTGSGSTA